ncbi:helix-turn-helix domain-containing protein (plasmid) [Streptomyces decoyicus]|uniref:ArsR/SmtB family transcription factor n=1 Tax=Streptomyces decoyicus TaxID=249567 RepID=UPI002E3470EB|nr:helix-turn-helix domain-containing protein [Streptomyces decoyicus]
MLRIHFTAADIARTRLGAGVGPVLETAFAAVLMGRGIGMPYLHWRRKVGGRLPSCPGPPPTVGELAGWAEQFLDGSDSPQLPPPLVEVWQAAVAPYWDRMTAYLEAEREARSRIVMSGGVEQLLATLHPRLEWHAPVLEVAGAPDGDIRLDGRGVVLAPSVFLADPPAQVLPRRRPGNGAVLAFAAPPDAHRALWLWEDSAGTERPLGALVGQTRAAALRVLRTTCTTSQLAHKLGISPAGASQHTAVLRASGLITTRRIRNTVLHTVTPLGMALLDSRGPGPRQTGRARRALPV